MGIPRWLANGAAGIPFDRGVQLSQLGSLDDVRNEIDTISRNIAISSSRLAAVGLLFEELQWQALCLGRWYASLREEANRRVQSSGRRVQLPIEILQRICRFAYSDHIGSSDIQHLLGDPWGHVVFSTPRIILSGHKGLNEEELQACHPVGLDLDVSTYNLSYPAFIFCPRWEEVRWPWNIDRDCHRRATERVDKAMAMIPRRDRDDLGRLLLPSASTAEISFLTTADFFQRFHAPNILRLKIVIPNWDSVQPQTLQQISNFDKVTTLRIDWVGDDSSPDHFQEEISEHLSFPHLRSLHIRLSQLNYDDVFDRLVRCFGNPQVRSLKLEVWRRYLRRNLNQSKNYFTPFLARCNEVFPAVEKLEFILGVSHLPSPGVRHLNTLKGMDPGLPISDVSLALGGKGVAFPKVTHLGVYFNYTGLDKAALSQLVSARAKNINASPFSNLTLYSNNPVAVFRDNARVFLEVLHSHVPNIYLEEYR